MNKQTIITEWRISCVKLLHQVINILGFMHTPSLNIIQSLLYAAFALTFNRPSHLLSQSAKESHLNKG